MKPKPYEYHRQIQETNAETRNRYEVIDISKQNNDSLLEMLGFKVDTVQNCIHTSLKEAQKKNFKAHIFCELVKRYNKAPFPRGKEFKDATTVFEHYQYLREEKQQKFIVITLDGKHRLLEEHLISVGTLNRIIIHPRDCFYPAIKTRAAAMICVQNHTSGCPLPTPEDSKTGFRLVEVGKLVGIPVLDIVTIGDTEYYSFADRGLW